MDETKERLFCVSCRAPVSEVHIAELENGVAVKNGIWVICLNKDCPRVGLISGVSLSVHNKGAES